MLVHKNTTKPLVYLSKLIHLTMILFFLLITCGLSSIFFTKNYFLKTSLINKIFCLHLILLLILTSYYNSKWLIFLDIKYNFTQIINFFMISLFNTNWTNLLLLIIIVAFYFFFVNFKNSQHPNYLFVIQPFLNYSSLTIYIILLKNCSEIYNKNSEKLFFLKTFLSDVNTLLINNLVLIHPLCTHLLYGFFISLMFYYYYLETYLIVNDKISQKINFFKQKAYFYAFIYFYLFKTNFFFIFVSYLAVLLGSIWAAQELVWNTWWNWDIIEIIAFCFFIVLVLFLHSMKKQNCFFQMYLYISMSSILFVLFYFFIRLDISGSLHSFNMFDSIEIYFYFFCFFFVFLNNIILKNKLFLKIIKVVAIPTTPKFLISDFIIYFFKIFITLFYCYCFIIWVNDVGDFTIKNEIIWIYSLICKYTIIFLYIIYYWSLIKINWLILISVSAITIWNLFSWFILKNLLNASHKTSLLVHGLIFLFLTILLMDNFIQLFSYELQNFERTLNNLILTNKKLVVFYWTTTVSALYNLINSQIIFNKYYLNSFLLFKYNYLINVNFDVIYWHEQTYNYYVSNNFFENTLINVFYKENNYKVHINKNFHYYLIAAIFFVYLLRIYHNKKIKFWYFI